MRGERRANGAEVVGPLRGFEGQRLLVPSAQPKLFNRDAGRRADGRQLGARQGVDEQDLAHEARFGGGRGPGRVALRVAGPVLAANRRGVHLQADEGA